MHRHIHHVVVYLVCFFFFNDTATTEIYTLSLHDALPIWFVRREDHVDRPRPVEEKPRLRDRKSTRLNSSHMSISYAVFCLKKKNNEYSTTHRLCATARDPCAASHRECH